MLRKQDIENYSHKFNVFLLPLFNPVLASDLHTWRSPDWLLLDCSGTLRRFKVTGLKVWARGQQTFFFVSVCDLKSQDWQLSGQKRDSRC